MPIIRADICVIGDVQTGKTSLIKQYLGEDSKQIVPTMFPDLYTKKIRIPDSDTFVELFIYDTPTHPLTWNLASKSIAECEFMILMCASDSMDSYDICSHWVRIFADATMQDEKNQKIKGVLAVNEYNGVNIKSEEEQEAFAKNMGLFSTEVDCLKGKDCDVPFNMIAELAYNLDKKNQQGEQK